MTRREAVLWSSAAAAAWVLAGYPAALATRPRRPWLQDRQSLPRLSLVIPAYREREALARKLAAGLDYPRDRLEVLVAVDADPELADVARAHARVLFAPERAGKAAALNRAVAAATGDVVVLTDANNVLDPNSLHALARHFADPSVWAVAGRRGEEGSAYDRYEELIRRLETRSGSVAAASGELFAVRRERLPHFPEGVVNDDLWLLTQLVRAGGRVVYEPAARSIEPALPAGAELARRSRIGAGRALLLGELRGLPPGYAWRLLSHKHGRLALPFLLLAIAAASASLAARPAYRALAAAEAAACALGLAAIAGHPLGRAGRAAGQFLLGNAAIAIGVVRALRGRQDVRWEAVR